MDYLDGDDDIQPRPRLLLSRGGAPTTLSTTSTSAALPHAAACIAASLLLLAGAYALLPASQTLGSLLLWLASSLLLAPFAPSSFTGGDVSVGRGHLLPSPAPPPPQEPNPNPTPRRPRRSNPNPPPKPSDPIPAPAAASPVKKPAVSAAEASTGEEDEGEWTEQEMELLRRQMAKHPAGEPRRWEKIAAAFSGRRSPETVIRAAKSGGAAATGDSFEQFLRRRKPLDPRAEEKGVSLEGLDAKNGELEQRNESLEGNSDGKTWSSGDDIALLNALKAFPKEVNMRWEKIAAAVPGKTKAACVKRVAELKRDFRSSKAPEAS